MTGLRCPRCSFTFSPRATFLLLEHCPRCLGRSHVAVPLERVPAKAGDPAVRAAQRAARERRARSFPRPPARPVPGTRLGPSEA